jgi:transposase
MDSGAFAALIGIDWADDHHDVALQESGTDEVERSRLVHTPKDLSQWLHELGRRFGGRKIGIAVETSRGPLIHVLLQYDFVTLYPINPRSAQRFRQAFAPSGAKDDPVDADLLLEILIKHRDRLRAWRPDTADIRALQRLTEHRRKIVDQKTKLTQQLTALLKDYFPQALSWAGARIASGMGCDFLLKWPSLQALQRSRPDTVRSFYHAHNCRGAALVERRLREIRSAVPLTEDPAIIEPNALRAVALVRQLQVLLESVEAFDEEIERRFAAHDDAHLFEDLPGSGPVLAPRLLAAFGADRDRFPSAADLQQVAGIAPVTERSGKREWVHWRWSASTFLRQTFHEFAHQSVRSSAWARAYYEIQRDRGKSHPAAVRALAFKWIRVLWRCWIDRTPYSEDRYIAALRRRHSPIADRLNLNHDTPTLAA